MLNSTPTRAPVRIERGDGFARITVDRPEARNAISAAVMEGLEDALDVLEADPPNVVSFRGGGDRAFVSGGDLKEFSSIRGLDAARSMATRVRRILDRVVGLSSITIAELNGAALGGGAELAVACDIRVAADDVRLAFSQSTLAITPAWGGTERLTELVGRSRALYLLTTGVALPAQQACEWGLIEEVVPRVDFERRVNQLVGEIASRASPVLRSIKGIVSTVHPGVHPESAHEATELFAQAWVADAHWDAMNRARRE